MFSRSDPGGGQLQGESLLFTHSSHVVALDPFVCPSVSSFLPPKPLVISGDKSIAFSIYYVRLFFSIHAYTFANSHIRLHSVVRHVDSGPSHPLTATRCSLLSAIWDITDLINGYSRALTHKFREEHNIRGLKVMLWSVEDWRTYHGYIANNLCILAFLRSDNDFEGQLLMLYW